MSASERHVHYFLIESLRKYTENFVLNDDENPLSFRLNGNLYSVHVSIIHDSGENRDNADEQRIQIQRSVRDKQEARRKLGYRIAFIGFFPGGDVFSAWEPDYVLSLKMEQTGSIYARESHHEAVDKFGGALRGFRSRNVGREVSLISLRSNALGFYLENVRTFHELTDEGTLREIIRKSDGAVSEGDMPGSISTDVEINGKRKKFHSVRYGYPRSAAFTKRVLEAYKGRCAVCSRQLGLVQAAHLIPHCEEDSTDDVFNGIGLCIEHHKLYDDGLLLPTTGRKFILNEVRVQFLEETGRARGMDEIKKIAAGQYEVPDNEESHPRPANLKRGILLRMGRNP